MIRVNPNSHDYIGKYGFVLEDTDKPGWSKLQHHYRFIAEFDDESKVLLIYAMDKNSARIRNRYLRFIDLDDLANTATLAKAIENGEFEGIKVVKGEIE